MVEQTVLRIMLRQWSFTIFATVVGAERFEVTSSLALETDASSHMCGKDFVNK
jgi:hypothetical protein